jgi:hypothetical protein
MSGGQAGTIGMVILFGAAGLSTLVGYKSPEYWNQKNYRIPYLVT